MAVVCGTSQRYIEDFSTGLYGKRYEGYFFDHFPHFNESNGEIAKPYSSIDAFVGSFDGRPYSWMWLGYFKAPTSGYYTFYIESNDSSWMWLGEGAFDKTSVETALIDNSGVHVFALREKSATIYLRAGEMYPLRVLYGYLYDTDSMTLSFEGPGIAKTTNGTGYYFGGEYLFNASFGFSVEKKPARRKNNAFEFTIETTTANEEFLLPLTGVTSIDVDWGDGTVETGITTNSPTHTYTTAGTHAISVTGSATSVAFDGSGSESKLRTVTNLGDLGWSSFENSFRDCSSMTSFECGDTDTSNVTNMQFMFSNCSSLTTLDVSGFDTSSATTIRNMFASCSSLTTVDVSGFDTSSVTNMVSMFNVCSSLTTLDVSNFNTTNVENMSSMFSNCSSLTALDVSGFNTSSLSGISGMFRACSSLTALDVSGFNTSGITDMRDVFQNCSSLTTLDVSAFDMSSVTQMGAMLSSCSLLENLDIDGWNVTSLTNGSLFLFNSNNAITTIQYDRILRNWSAQSLQSNVSIHFGHAQYTPGGSAEAAKAVLTDTYNWIIIDQGPVSNFNSAFEFTIETTTANEEFLLPMLGVTSIDVDWGDGNVDTGITTDNPTHTYATAGTYSVSVTGSATRVKFDGSGSEGKLRTVTNLGALGWTNLEQAFRYCQSLTSFSVGDCDTSQVTSFRQMFNWTQLVGDNPNFTGFETSSASDFYFMFRGSSFLQSLDVSTWDMSLATDIHRLFSGTGTIITGLDTWEISSVIDATNFLETANNALTTEQYEEVLINWASQPLQSGVIINFGDATVTPGSRGANARQYLVDKYDWIITDGGPA